MLWEKLISNKRLGQEGRHAMRHDDRSEFRRDYDRLIFSAPFRRLQNKTQVFPLPGSIFVHNRLTHSLEVACVGRSLGDDVAARLTERYGGAPCPLFNEIGNIVSAACLAHDMGNPPFGHSGEKAIQAFFTEGGGQDLEQLVSAPFWNDITHFEGNANAFRLLTHRFKGRRDGGFAMTYSMLASIVKYPFSSTMAGRHGKFGFFSSERDTYLRIADDLGICPAEGNGKGGVAYSRHPLVYLVEAADDICYEIMDIEDAHKVGLVSYAEAAELLLAFFDSDTQQAIKARIATEGLTDDNEKMVYIRSRVIGLLVKECVDVFVNNVEAILAGTFQGSLIKNTPQEIIGTYKRCSTFSVNNIYNSKIVLDVELSGYKIIETLMDAFVEAALSPDKFHSRQLIRLFSSQYDIDSQDLETRLMAIIDYISGMTDVYALDIYQKINGMSLPVV